MIKSIGLCDELAINDMCDGEIKSVTLLIWSADSNSKTNKMFLGIVVSSTTTKDSGVSSSSEEKRKWRTSLMDLRTEDAYATYNGRCLAEIFRD